MRCARTWEKGSTKIDCIETGILSSKEKRMEKKFFDGEEVEIRESQKVVVYQQKTSVSHNDRWSADRNSDQAWCLWNSRSMVENSSQCIGILEPIDARLEVRRTINRVELTAFWMSLRGLCAPASIHADTIGSLKGLYRGGKRCIGPEAKAAYLWFKIRVRSKRRRTSRSSSWWAMKQQQIGWRRTEQIWMVVQ